MEATKRKHFVDNDNDNDVGETQEGRQSPKRLNRQNGGEKCCCKLVVEQQEEIDRLRNALKESSRKSDSGHSLEEKLDKLTELVDKQQQQQQQQQQQLKQDAKPSVANFSLDSLHNKVDKLVSLTLYKSF
jgi:Skp family chaperone for outer membrane proteins